MGSNNPGNNAIPNLSSTIWLSHPEHGFIPGQILDIHGNNKLTVQPIDGGPASTNSGSRGRGGNAPVDVDYSSVFPAEDDPLRDYDDNCGLMYLNEATLLHNVRRRWERKEIYTYTANMLIALNPYTANPALYSSSTITKYQNRSLGTLPPHIFAIGDKAYRDMKTTKNSQSIIVSGESGAGKTESTKYILKFLCASFGAGEVGAVERRILDANPILESFGNAKTTRNNNSSRFGKFIEIHFDDKFKVGGGYISHYLLEKSRISTLSNPSERNYHIFYQLLTGLDSSTRGQLGLSSGNPKDYGYLSKGTCDFFDGVKLKDPIVHDKNDFGTLQTCFRDLDFKDSEILEIYKIVALVLHLGNIGFKEDDQLTSKGGCLIEENANLDFATKLAGLEKDELTNALTNRVMQTHASKKGTVIQVPLKKYEAVAARDALAKAIYSKLFDYIVRKINTSIPTTGRVLKYYIGVLDIAGFEYFKLNSFEQFCINYCNEKLQQFFNERVLKDEQQLYEKEGLKVRRIEYVDNIDCIELIEGKPVSILSLLDEEGKLPKPSYQHFTSEVHRQFAGNFRLDIPRKSKIKEHREILDDSGFIIRHFAGAVCYESKSFLEKNNDALHFSLELLVKNCESAFLRGLFEEEAKAKDGAANAKGKLSFVSVAGKFKTQLSELLEKLRSTGTSFVRCVKPNGKMVSGVFEGGLILSQLQCAGMTSVLELMQGGFPSRVHFQNLYDTYKNLLPPKMAKLDPRFFCRMLFKAVGLHEEDFRFGLTRVFFRPGKFKEFDMIMRSDPEQLLQMVAKVQKWIVVSKWKRVCYCAWSAVKLKRKILYRREALIKVQSTVKMYLAKKKYRPRVKALGKLSSLLAKVVQESGESVKKLRKSQSECLKEVEKVEKAIRERIKDIKTNGKITPQTLQKHTDSSLKETEALLKLITRKIEEERNAEEIEKARKMKEEMEKERLKKEAEEKEKKEEEENKKRKAEMEKRRKSEDLKLAKLEKAEEKGKGKKGPANTSDDEGISMREEQEKRDTEMATRLAREGSGTIMEDGGALRRSEVVNKNKDKKYDLSGWKYSELRDCINTSCDVELLNACREEFHRRLKVYHAWKAKNSQKVTNNPAAPASNNLPAKNEEERAPKSVYQYQQSHRISSAAPPIDPNADRFFRVPFQKEGMNKGLWYAHFRGEFIQRQLEVMGASDFRCYTAGKDDMQMCELKLSETGLTRKRGAEILEYEFEREWDKGVEHLRQK